MPFLGRVSIRVNAHLAKSDWKQHGAQFELDLKETARNVLDGVKCESVIILVCDPRVLDPSEGYGHLATCAFSPENWDDTHPRYTSYFPRYDDVLHLDSQDYTRKQFCDPGTYFNRSTGGLGPADPRG